MVDQPTITTARLLRRPFADTDLDDLVRCCSDKAVAEMTSRIPHPYTREHGEEFLRARHEQRSEGADRGIVFAITLRTTSAFVGACGLRIQDQHAAAELGYWIARQDWGNGYATEAAAAVVAYSFNTLNLRRVHATFFQRNPASGRVLDKIGFVREGCQRQHIVRFGRTEDLILVGLLREEWAANPFPGGSS